MKSTYAGGTIARALVALTFIVSAANCSSGGGAHQTGTTGSGGHAGAGSAGVGAAGNGAAGNGAAGDNTGGTGNVGGTGNAGGSAAGASGSAGVGAAGNGAAGNGAAGNGAAGNGAAGNGAAGSVDAAAGSDGGVDAPKDSPVDTGTDTSTDTGTDSGTDVVTCGADGMACEAASGVAGTCLNHVCKVCVDTTDDAKCATAYGTGHLCVAGKCVAGDCHGSAGCTIAGQVCGATVANKCGACASDTQCQTDTHYGAATICNTTTGQTNSGKCVSSTCNALGTCAANAGDTCCSLKCVTGNCCDDNDCHTNSMFGATYFCDVNHVCSKCAAATGNQYFVDPVNGDDSTATGSGKTNAANLPSCSFRTITRALQVIGATPAAGTVITVVGAANVTTQLYVKKAVATDPAPETLPIPVPANVKIATSVGPISMLLAATSSGFTLAGDGAGIAAVTAAPLTIDGNLHTSGVGILVAPGAGKAASLANVNVKNTGDDGISVTSGNVAIGAGVTVTSAGVAAARASGLNVTGGVVTITVPAGQTASTFNTNSLHGIEVTLLGVVNVTGVPAADATTTGGGTVTANDNTRSNVYVAQTPGMAPSVGTLDGIVAWNSAAAGFELVAGSSVKVRNSVSLENGTDGVLITGAADTAAGNALAGIDLGVAATATATFGKNILQATLASTHANPGAGICLHLGMNGGAQNLAAAGNTFAGPLDCSKTTPGAGLVKAVTCANHVDEAILPATGTTPTITSSNCL